MITTRPARQLHLLPAATSADVALAAADAAPPPASPAALAQLSLLSADALPAQLRLDARTRRVGRAGIAELRRILAGPVQAA